MGKFIDLTGQKFGKLIVVSREKNNKQNQAYWKCLCDCGNETIVRTANLKNGSIKSCGCLRRENYNDLLGKKFGMLTVIRKTDIRKNKQLVWECICDCGNIAYVRGGSLAMGKTVSCGCKNIENQERVRETLEPFLYGGTCIPQIIDERKINKNNTSGVRGVSYSARRNKWVSQICIKRKTINLGRYDTLEDAIKARKRAEEELFQPIIEEYKELKVGDINGN